MMINTRAGFEKLAMDINFHSVVAHEEDEVTKAQKKCMTETDLCVGW